MDQLRLEPQNVANNNPGQLPVARPVQENIPVAQTAIQEGIFSRGIRSIRGVEHNYPLLTRAGLLIANELTLRVGNIFGLIASFFFFREYARQDERAKTPAEVAAPKTGVAKIVESIRNWEKKGTAHLIASRAAFGALGLIALYGIPFVGQLIVYPFFREFVAQAEREKINTPAQSAIQPPVAQPVVEAQVAPQPQVAQPVVEAQVAPQPAAQPQAAPQPAAQLHPAQQRPLIAMPVGIPFHVEPRQEFSIQLPPSLTTGPKLQFPTFKNVSVNFPAPVMATTHIKMEPSFIIETAPEPVVINAPQPMPGSFHIKMEPSFIIETAPEPVVINAPQPMPGSIHLKTAEPTIIDDEPEADAPAASLIPDAPAISEDAANPQPAPRVPLKTLIRQTTMLPPRDLPNMAEARTALAHVQTTKREKVDLGVQLVQNVRQARGAMFQTMKQKYAIDNNDGEINDSEWSLPTTTVAPEESTFVAPKKVEKLDGRKNEVVQLTGAQLSLVADALRRRRSSMFG